MLGEFRFFPAKRVIYLRPYRRESPSIRFSASRGRGGDIKEIYKFNIVVVIIFGCMRVCVFIEIHNVSTGQGGKRGDF